MSTKSPRHSRMSTNTPPTPHPQSLPRTIAKAHAPHDDAINILIVDDEPKNLTVLETILDDPGYRLVRAESADQALLALVTDEFALLILDISMPDLTGFELAQMIKQRKKTADVPIIFLTAYYNDDQHVLEGYGSGAVDYLHKPVNAAILRSMVAVFAELYRNGRACSIANSALLAEVTERFRAQTQLSELNATLEQRVIERTEALAMTNVALHKTGERYRSLFEGSLDAIISLDTDGRFETANPAALRLTGHTLDALKTTHFLDLCTPDLQDVTKHSFRAAFCGECITLDTAILTASGERRDVFVSGTPTMVDGNIVGMSCILHDVTERKRIVSDLNLALISAEKANSAKSDFLSSMSHDLRTPLNSILGFAQLIESGTPAPTPTQQQNLNHILKGGWYLLELINEILDLAVIESGNMSLSWGSVSLDQIMLECRAMIEPQADQRGISLTFTGFETPYFVEADHTRVKQVLINLLVNAIKYNTPGGAVTVACALSAPDSIRISIRDTGVGLAAEQLSQLFQPFNRLGQEFSSEEGTGIGLMVSKRLVELMGGAIGAASELGVGSVFWVELNLTTPPQQLIPERENVTRMQPQGPEGLPVRTLLYVEDNPANLELVKQIIEGQPHICMLIARDALVGVSLAHAHLPDVILMDINLPGISGSQALKILRDDPTTAHIPVIALSANAIFRDIEQGLAAGFFHYLTKPIKIDEFMDAVNAALEHSGTRVGAVPVMAAEPRIGPPV